MQKTPEADDDVLFLGAFVFSHNKMNNQEFLKNFVDNKDPNHGGPTANDNITIVADGIILPNGVTYSTNAQPAVPEVTQQSLFNNL